MSAIRTVGLSKAYKDVLAVDGLSLEVKEGELFGLLGVNGAGKTTTIKMLSTLTEKSGGEGFVGGFSLDGDKDRIKEIIGISTQDTAVARNLTVDENIGFIASLYYFDKEERTKAKEEIIEKFSLDAVRGKRAGTLSGGWQRRLSIALALVSSPKILFLDEPTLGLDVIARREIWKIISSLKGKMTVILTTHYMEEAESLCDRIAVMAKGRLIEVGTPKELTEKANATNFEDAFIRLAGGEL